VVLKTVWNADRPFVASGLVEHKYSLFKHGGFMAGELRKNGSSVTSGGKGDHPFC